MKNQASQCYRRNGRQPDMDGKRHGTLAGKYRKDILEPIAAETLHYGVRTLLPDGKGTLYIGSEAGLFIYKTGTWNKSS